MISKENLIEWKVSCLCLFTECLLQSPGSSICCGKEWVAKCQCEWLMVWSPGERCDVYEVSANNTAQCKQGPGKKHSDLATRTLNNGHLMGTPRERLQNDKHSGSPTQLCRLCSALSQDVGEDWAAFFQDFCKGLTLCLYQPEARMQSEMPWQSKCLYFGNYVHKHCHSEG